MNNDWGGGEKQMDDFDKQFEKAATSGRRFVWAVLAIILVVLTVVAFAVYKVVMHFWW